MLDLRSVPLLSLCQIFPLLITLYLPCSVMEPTSCCCTIGLLIKPHFLSTVSCPINTTDIPQYRLPAVTTCYVRNELAPVVCIHWKGLICNSTNHKSIHVQRWYQKGLLRQRPTIQKLACSLSENTTPLLNIHKNIRITRFTESNTSPTAASDVCRSYTPLPFILPSFRATGVLSCWESCWLDGLYFPRLRNDRLHPPDSTSGMRMQIQG